MSPEGKWHVGVPGLFANSYDTLIEAQKAVDYYMGFFQEVNIWSDEMSEISAAVIPG